MKYIKGYNLFIELYNNNCNFKNIIFKGFRENKIRFFNEEEWNKINSQNYISPTPLVNDFKDVFITGLNIGDCVGISRQLSYSYNDVDIVSGILPLLKGTLNAEKEGGHCWLETKNIIIDTSLMLIIDKSLKKEIGYIEEQRLTSWQLNKMQYYQARKAFVNDKGISKTRKKW